MIRRSFFVLFVFWATSAGSSSLFAQNGAEKRAALVPCARRVVSVPPAAGMLGSDGSQIFIGTLNGTIEALASGNLNTNWRAELGGEFASDLILIENWIAVATNPSRETINGTREPINGGDVSTVRLISKESGVTVWAAKVAYSERYYLGKINGSVAIVSKEGQVTLLDRSSGQVHSQTVPVGKLSARPVFSAGNVALATADKQLTVISAQGGRIVSRQTTDHVITALAFLKKDAIAAGDERGNVTLFGTENTKVVWRFKSGAGVSSVSETEQGILVTSLDNFVYMISDYNGDVIWKRRLTGRVLEGGLAMNGHIVILIYGENSAYVIDMAQGKLTDSLGGTERDLVNRTPVSVRDRTFALTTVDSVDLYSLGGCDK